MRANLTLFQTTVAADSCGKVPILVREEEPWTACLFLPAQVTLVLGVMDLIVAVVVDILAELRMNDHTLRTAELEREERSVKQASTKTFESIDIDQSGSVTVDELEAGLDHNTDFRQRLRAMDVSRSDLKQPFQILDEDGSGDVCPDEFIDTFYRLKCADSRSASVLVKHYVLKIRRHQERMVERVGELT